MPVNILYNLLKISPLHFLLGRITRYANNRTTYRIRSWSIFLMIKSISMATPKKKRTKAELKAKKQEKILQRMQEKMLKKRKSRV